MFPNIPLQWVTAQDLIMALHAYSGWTYNLSRTTSYFLYSSHEYSKFTSFLFFPFITCQTFCVHVCVLLFFIYFPQPTVRSSRTSNQAHSRESCKDEEKLGSEPERQIGLASIGLKVKRRDNKQEKLPVITGFNIFLFLLDPFLLSLPLFFLSFRAKIPGLRQTY